MSERDDDGQALTAVLSDTGPAFPGTLRDWFAGQALVGTVGLQHGMTEATVANSAYGYADAMMAERAKVAPLTYEPAAA